MTMPPRDLRRDLLAALLVVLGLAAAVASCMAGGWPFVFAWAALILLGCAGVLGTREPAAAPREPGLADPNDPNAMHVESARGPDTT
jgi:uncharacterized protein (DUF58 family)